MGNLLKLDFHNLKRQKSFYICLAIMIALLVLSALAQKYLPSMLPGVISSFMPSAEEMAAQGMSEEEIAEVMSSMSAFGATTDRGYFILAASSNAMYVMLSSIFIAISVCSVHEQQILKNTYARGYSRGHVFFSKAIFILVACTAMFIIINLVSALLSVLFLGMKDVYTGIFKHIAVAYLVCIALNSMHLAIASMIKQTGGTIAVSIVAPSVIFLLLSVLQSVLKIKSPIMSDYWLGSFLESAISVSTFNSRLTEIAILSCVYFAVFTIAGYLLNRKNEV